MEKQHADGSARRRSLTVSHDGGSTRQPHPGLALFLDSVPGAWLFARRDGSFAHVSQGACEALGHSREQLLAARVFDIDPSLSPERWERHWESMLPGQALTRRTRHRRRDGTEYVIDVRSHELELEGELLNAWYAIDPAGNEKAALASPPASRAQPAPDGLFEHLPDLVFRLRLEPQPTFTFLSPSSKTLLGYWPSDLVADEHALLRVVHPDDCAHLLRLHELPPRTGRKVRFLDRDGRVVWMELRVAPVAIADGSARVIEGVARDVTQSHHAELQSRRLWAAIEQAPEAVLVTSAEGIVEYVNPAYRHTSGIAERDALGKPWCELEVRKDKAFSSRLAAALSKGEVWQGRIQSERTSGARYEEDATLAPIRDESGRQVGCVAVKRDVTEQRALEEQLHQAQKLEAVSQLAGGIAHDFNNLLHVIQGHTHMMQALDLNGFRHERDLTEMLREVDKAAARAATLVRQLLAFSRKGGAEFSELRLDELLASLHGALQHMLGPNIQLMLRCDAGPVVVLGNAAQLEQLLTNLCINARESMRRGGFLHVTLEPAAPGGLPTSFRRRSEVAYVRLTVRDEGAGMTREVQRRLYEPFFTTKQPGEGVGLGLATVYAIVQSHQGFIEAASALGKGTTFSVHLPRADGGGHPRPRTPGRRRVEGRGRLVLVAEDEPAVLQLTSYYLRQAGFEVMQASNGPESERLLDERGSEIALAVLDAVMPGFGGQGVRQAMKDRDIGAPVIVVTGYDHQTLARVLGDDRVAMLQKPFGQTELLDQVGRLLMEPA